MDAETRRLIGEWRRRWQEETSLDIEEMDELQEHLLEATEAHRAAGLDPEAAVRTAIDQIGPPPDVGREYDKSRTPPGKTAGLTTLSFDVRYAFRQLIAHPFFTLVAVVSIGVAVAANTVAFSVINGLLLRDPGYGDSEGLVEVYTGSIDDPNSQSVSSWPISDDLAEFTDLFEGVIGFEPLFGRMLLDGSYTPVFGEVVSGDFFDVLRVPIVIGRGFTVDDERLRSSVAVISHDLYRQRFGGQPDALGRTLEVNGEQLTVIGVASDDFSGAMPALAGHVWLPRWALPLGEEPSETAPLPEENRERWLAQLKGRLRPGVTALEAETVLRGRAGELAAAYPESYSEVQFSVIPTDDVSLSPALDGIAFGLAGGVMAVVAMVLIIASMNLAGFLLARGADRWSELELRHALGATRSRLVAQLFTESLILALCGGALGLGLCLGALELIARFRPPIPIVLEFDFSVDGTVLLFTVGVTLVAAVLFGLIPAFRATRLSGNRGAAGGASGRVAGSGRTRAVLLTCQVAASLVFLVWGSLFTRSLLAEASIDPGFRTHDAAVITLEAASAGYGRAELPDLLSRFESSAARRPELSSLAFTNRVPLGPVSSSVNVSVPGAESEEARSTQTFAVEPGYFQAMEIPLLEGRSFLPTDRDGEAGVAIVSRSFMERYANQGVALGGTLELDGTPVELVGVVEDVRVERPREQAIPVVYQPLSQTGVFLLSVVGVASESSGEALLGLRLVVEEVDPTISVWSSSTIEDHLGTKLIGPRVAAGLMMGAATIALLLTLIGVFGSVSYAVSRRGYEMAIRLSLGATPDSVIRLVIKGMLTVIGTGALVGLVVSLAGGGALRSLLYGVAPFDPLSFVLATALLTGAAVLAAVLPARRAGRTELTKLLKEG